MASAGLRIGAIPSLCYKDLESIDKYGIYKLTVYRRSNSKYVTFCSIETRNALENYLSWRERLGERLKPGSPLFRRTFDRYISEDVYNPKPLSVNTLQWIINQCLNSSGVRPSQHMKEGQRYPGRTHLMQAHGLRKYFETQAINASMSPLFVRRLMGQKSGLEDSYFRPSESDILEGNDKMVGYIGIIDALTINEEHKLRREVRTLKHEVTRFDKMEKQIEELNRKLGLD